MEMAPKTHAHTRTRNSFNRSLLKHSCMPFHSSTLLLSIVTIVALGKEYKLNWMSGIVRNDLYQLF